MAQQFDYNHLSALAEELSQQTKSLAATGSDQARALVRQKAEKLLKSLETPQESMLRMWLLEGTTKAVLQVGYDLDLFKFLSEAEGKPVTNAELADKTGADPKLLARLLKHLAAAGIIGEAGPDVYFATGLTSALSTVPAKNSFEYFDYMFGPLLASLPKFLAQRQWQEPTLSTDSPFQLGFNTKMTPWEYAKTDPKLARLFQAVVLSQEHVRRPRWQDPGFYPVQERLLSGAKDGGVTLVDVGGGIGPDSILFQKAFPNTKLVLQDLAQVIDSVTDLPPSIEKLSHDFFQEQPVKGARAYYFHRVFHDWADPESKQLLLALKPAMTPGYSRLLIHDHVLPPQNASWLGTASDLLMMCGFSGRERTEVGFRALLESVGMVVTGIWTRVPGEESVLEAMVPASLE